MKNYLTPDFDVTIYDVEDLITADASVTGGDVGFGKDDPNEGGDWFG